MAIKYDPGKLVWSDHTKKDVFYRCSSEAKAYDSELDLKMETEHHFKNIQNIFSNSVLCL